MLLTERPKSGLATVAEESWNDIRADRWCTSPALHKTWTVEAFVESNVGEYVVNVVETICQGSRRHNVAAMFPAQLVRALSESSRRRSFPLTTDNFCLDIVHRSAMVENVRDFYGELAKHHLNSIASRQEYLATVDIQCERLLRILECARNLRQITDATSSMMASAVGRLWLLFLNAMLSERDISAECLELQNHFDCSRALDVTQDLATIVGRTITEQAHNPVLLISTAGLPNLHGEDSTTFCAAATAVALKASQLHIWNTSGGVFTADPGIVPKARKLEMISVPRAVEMCLDGQQHVAAMALLWLDQAPIPTCVKDVVHPSATGTRIASATTSEAACTRSSAVTLQRNVDLVTVSSKSLEGTGEMWQAVASAGMHVLLMSSSQRQISMAINAGELRESTLSNFRTGLNKSADVRVSHNKAILSVLGGRAGARRNSVESLCSVLRSEHVHYDLLSQVSDSKVSCVIPIARAEVTVVKIHDAVY